LSAEQITDAAARRSRIGLGWVGGVAAAVLIVAAIITLDYEPADMVVVGPLYLLILAALGAAGPALYRLSMARLRDDTARRLARMAPPGTTLHLDATALTLDGRATPWPAIAVETVEIVTVSNPDGDDDYRVDAVMLAMRDQTVVLDQAVMTNGQRIVDQVLRIRGVDFR